MPFLLAGKGKQRIPVISLSEYPFVAALFFGAKKFG